MTKTTSVRAMVKSLEEKLNAAQEKMVASAALHAITQKEILTLEEACLYTGISKSAMYKLTMNCQIPYSKPNGKFCFFRRAELENWLMKNPVSTVEERVAKALAHVSPQRRSTRTRKK